LYNNIRHENKFLVSVFFSLYHVYSQMMEPSLPPTRTAAYTGAFWAAAGSLIRYALAGIITLILTQLLDPRDFGLVALTYLAHQLIAHTALVGFHDALIQRPTLEDADLDSAFWSIILTCGTGAILVIVLAPFLARWFNQPLLAPLLIVMAFAAMLRALSTVQRALLNRRLDFRTPTVARAAGLLLGGILAVLLALLGGGPWSLIAEVTMIDLVGAIWVWRTVHYVPRWRVDRSSLRHLWAFAPSVTLFTLLSYIITETDDQLIGFYLGPKELGFYVLAYSFMSWPVHDILGGASVVLYPILSRFQDDLPRLQATYLESLQLASLFAFPTLTLLAITGPVLVPWLLGPKWEAIVLTMQILAISGLREATGKLNGPIYRARGKPQLHALLGLCNTTCFVTAFWIGLDYGIAGVAFFYAITGVMLQPLYCWLILSVTELSLQRWLRAIVPAAIATVALAAVAIPLLQLTRGWGDLVSLVITVTISGLLYAALIWILTPLAVQKVVNFIRAKLIP
jgi:PST family polysaccharide transporter